MIGGLVIVLLGALLALAVALFAAAAGFDRERSYWPVLLVVVASDYELFAGQGGSVAEMALEAWLFCGFACLAVAGFRWNLGFVVAGLLIHGALDLFHGYLLQSPAKPAWWPRFCLAFDVTAAAVLLRRAGGPGRARNPVTQTPHLPAPRARRAWPSEDPQ